MGLFKVLAEMFDVGPPVEPPGPPTFGAAVVPGGPSCTGFRWSCGCPGPLHLWGGSCPKVDRWLEWRRRWSTSPKYPEVRKMIDDECDYFFKSVEKEEKP